MSSILHPEWLNENAFRAYPFGEDMQRIPTDPGGNQLTDGQLPNYVVVDCVVTLASSDDVRLYVSSLTLVGRLMTVSISEVGGNSIVCAASIDRSTHTTNRGYDLVGAGDWDDARGRIVIGDITNLAEDLADGLYQFDATQTRLEDCVVRPALRGVRSLQISDGYALSNQITGRVQLVAGENIRLDYDAINNAIWISAVPNAGYKEVCDCERVAVNPLLSINGVPLSSVELQSGSDCLKIATTGNQITFEDRCSTPCCGCEELQYLTEALRTLQAGITQLDAYASRLEDRINTFVTNYVLTL
jgi:hypothetical protein